MQCLPGKDFRSKERAQLHPALGDRHTDSGFSVFTAATHGTVRLTSVTTTSCRMSVLKEMDRGVLEGQDGDRDTHETEQERSFSGCMNAEF